MGNMRVLRRDFPDLKGGKGEKAPAHGPSLAHFWLWERRGETGPEHQRESCHISESREEEKQKVHDADDFHFRYTKEIVWVDGTEWEQRKGSLIYLDTPLGS
jgi:hypothetical protein